MPTFVIEIEKTSYNGVTGHRDFTAHVVEIADDGKTETSGPPETHGIDPLSLERIHGSVEAWVARVKEGMIQRHHTRTQVDEELMKMKGKRI